VCPLPFKTEFRVISHDVRLQHDVLPYSMRLRPTLAVSSLTLIILCLTHLQDIILPASDDSEVRLRMKLPIKCNLHSCRILEDSGRRSFLHETKSSILDDLAAHTDHPFDIVGPL
jgi:hypothetical protein